MSLTVSHIKLAVLAALLTLLLRSDVRGTTLIMLSDDDLTHGSAVIALGQVQSISSQSDSLEAIQTLVSIAVEEQIKGAPEATLTMAIPGGACGAVRRVVFGAPQFFLGERVLVFLRQRPDGFLVPNGLAMGKYTVVQRRDGDVARRQLAAAGTAVLTYDKRRGGMVQGAATDERPLADFLDDLRQIVAHEPPTPSGTAAVAQPSSATRFETAFTFLGSPPARWTAPDRALAVGYLVDPAGDNALGSVATLAAVHQAMAAWSSAGSALQLVDAGVARPAPFQACDGRSIIDFNDPFGEIGAPVNCGGVLALGGFCTTDSSASTVNGTAFVGITEGDITVNDGFGSCPFWTATNLAEVLTHELGHTFGLAHSSENPAEPKSVLKDATMYYLAHFDGRGASLRSDDVAGVRALYPAAPPTADVVQLRTFSIDGNGLVLNAIIHFPSGVVFQPTRDPILIELEDTDGAFHSGTAGARLLHHTSLRVTYGGVVPREIGTGVMVFTWMRGNSATLVLRVQGKQLPVAAGPATLSFHFGEQTFMKQLNLQPSGSGSWVPA